MGISGIKRNQLRRIKMYLVYTLCYNRGCNRHTSIYIIKIKPTILFQELMEKR
jgi:hypothetical protein